MSSVTIPKISQPTQRRTINQGSVLGAFIDSMSIQTAYAEDGTGVPIATAAQNTSYGFIYFLLFLILASMHVGLKLLYKGGR